MGGSSEAYRQQCELEDAFHNGRFEGHYQGEEVILALVINHAIDEWPPGEGAVAAMRIIIRRLLPAGAPVAMVDGIAQAWLDHFKGNSK